MPPSPHTRTPRLDKIYINGHSGEIKIGDLGLAVLAPRRFGPGVMPEGHLDNQYTQSVDIFAYGLLMLELISGKRLDKNGETGWQELQERLDSVQDDAAQAFLARCMAAPEQRPSAQELLEDPFLQVRGQGSGRAAGRSWKSAARPRSCPADAAVDALLGLARS